jgi:hypothetical protein
MNRVVKSVPSFLRSKLLKIETDQQSHDSMSRSGNPMMIPLNEDPVTMSSLEDSAILLVKTQF